MFSLEYMQSLVDDMLTQEELDEFISYLSTESNQLDQIDDLLSYSFEVFKRKKLFEKQSAGRWPE